MNEAPPLPEIAEPTPPEAPAEPELDEAGPVIEPEPAKRRPGRPAKTDPPTPRSAIIDRIQNLTSWEGTRVYLYRWEPFTDRKVGGRASVSVKRYEGPFDEQDIMEDPGLGSGVYELIVNRTDPQTRQRRMMDSGMVKILNMKYPPRIPKGEWMDDPRNKDWEWARNISEKTEPAGPTFAGPAPDPLVSILEKTIERQATDMAELRKEMRETAAAKKDPTEGIMAILAPFLPAIIQKLTAPPPDPITALAGAMKLLKDAAPPPPPPPPQTADPLAALERQFELSKKMEEQYGGGNTAAAQRSRMSGTQELIKEVVKEAAPVLAPIMQIIAMSIAQKQREAAEQAAQQRPQQPAQPAPRIVPRPATELVTQQPAPGPHAVPQVPTIDAIARQVVSHLENKKDGFELGDWYLEQFGMQEFTEIRAQGKTKLIADIQAVPQMASLLAAHEQTGALDKLITEFITWEPASDEDDDEDDDAPPIATSAAALSDANPWTEPAKQEARP